MVVAKSAWVVVFALTGALVGCGDSGDQPTTVTESDGAVCVVEAGVGVCSGGRPQQPDIGLRRPARDAVTARQQLVTLRRTSRARDQLPGGYRGPPLRVGTVRRVGPMLFAGRSFWIGVSEDNALCLVLRAPGEVPPDGLDYKCSGTRSFVAPVGDNYLVRPLDGDRGFVIGLVRDGIRCVLISRERLPVARVKVVRNAFVAPIVRPAEAQTRVGSRRFSRERC